MNKLRLQALNQMLCCLVVYVQVAGTRTNTSLTNLFWLSGSFELKSPGVVHAAIKPILQQRAIRVNRVNVLLPASAAGGKQTLCLSVCACIIRTNFKNEPELVCHNTAKKANTMEDKTCVWACCSHASPRSYVGTPSVKAGAGNAQRVRLQLRLSQQKYEPGSSSDGQTTCTCSAAPWKIKKKSWSFLSVLSANTFYPSVPRADLHKGKTERGRGWRKNGEAKSSHERRTSEVII